MFERRATRQIHVGNVAVGGGAPITVQSMTITKTADVEGTLQQIAISSQTDLSKFDEGGNGGFRLGPQESKLPGCLDPRVHTLVSQRGDEKLKSRFRIQFGQRFGRRVRPRALVFREHRL